MITAQACLVRSIAGRLFPRVQLRKFVARQSEYQWKHMKHMIRFEYFVWVLLLSGCATQVLSAGERTVVIKTKSNDIASAQDLAETVCRKRGLHARLSIKVSPVKYVFDCIE